MTPKHNEHTPGPWGISDLEGGIICDDKSRSRIAEVCLPYDLKKNQKEKEANARLIAAAPELLEALQDLRASLPYDLADSQCHAACIKAKRAITKATTGGKE